MATIVTRATKGAALTHSEMDANWNNLNDDTDQFPGGGSTKIPFFQSSAPPGWTQDATNHDAMLRVVNTAGSGTGGTDSPTTGLTSTDSHVLTITEMPEHTHTYQNSNYGTLNLGPTGAITLTQTETTTPTGSTGGDGGHLHNITWAPKFVNMIICSKD